MKDTEKGRQGDKENNGVKQSPCLLASLSPCLAKGAMILCGGESKRMGRDKALLPLGQHESMLERVVRIVAEVVPAENIICVAAPDQQLPPLPSLVRIVRDAEPHRGPLAGLAAGLQCSGDQSSRHTPRAAAAAPMVFFVTGCDAPLLVPGFITRLFEVIGDHPIAAPHDGQRWYPLAAVYHTDLLPQVESLLATGKRSLVALVESCDTRCVPVDVLREVDPALSSLATCNTPEEYESAVQIVLACSAANSSSAIV